MGMQQNRRIDAILDGCQLLPAFLFCLVSVLYFRGSIFANEVVQKDCLRGA